MRLFERGWIDAALERGAAHAAEWTPLSFEECVEGIRIPSLHQDGKQAQQLRCASFWLEEDGHVTAALARLDGRDVVVIDTVTRDDSDDVSGYIVRQAMIRGATYATVHGAGSGVAVNEIKALHLHDACQFAGLPALHLASETALGLKHATIDLQPGCLLTLVDDLLVHGEQEAPTVTALRGCVAVARWWGIRRGRATLQALDRRVNQKLGAR